MIEAKEALRRTLEQRKRVREENKARAEREKQHWLDTNKKLVEDSLAFVEKCIEDCIKEGVDFEEFIFLGTEKVKWQEIEDVAKNNYRFRAPWFMPYYIAQNYGLRLLNYVLKQTLLDAGYSVTAKAEGRLLFVEVSWDN